MSIGSLNLNISVCSVTIYLEFLAIACISLAYNHHTSCSRSFTLRDATERIPPVLACKLVLAISRATKDHISLRKPATISKHSPLAGKMGTTGRISLVFSHLKFVLLTLTFHREHSRLLRFGNFQKWQSVAGRQSA